MGEVGITFQLSGPGLSVVTDVDGGESATETWPVTLAPSSIYTCQNASQPGSSEVFSTSAAPAATTTATTPAATTSSGGGVESNGVRPTTTSSPATHAPAAAAPLPLRGTLTASVSARGR